MFTIPFAVLISFPIPNYQHPVTRGQQISIVSATFMSITTLFVIVRLYQRIFVRRWFGPDDLFTVMGYIFAIGVTAVTVIGNEKFEWNRHVWDVHETKFQSSLELMYFGRIFWGLSTSFVRLSVLCLYYRLLRSSGAPPHHFMVLHITTFLSTVLMVYYFISGVVPCVPIRAYWVFPPMENSKCFNDSLSLQVCGVVNTTMEFWVATLPLLATFRLGVQKNQRWSVVNILCLGYLTVIAGSFRTYYVWKAVTTYDYTWWSGPQWIASEVEIDMALICSCAAPLRPLMSRIARHVGKHPNSIHSSKHPQSDSENDGYVDHPRKKLRSESVVTTKMSNISQDREAINEWTQAMSRTIDLEGIAADGFGYTVTITGPISNQPPPRSRGIFHLPWRRSSQGAVKQERRHSGVEMTKQTDVSVQQTWSSSFDQSTSRRHESRLNSICPAALDDLTFADMGLHMNGLLDDNAGEQPLSPLPVHPMPVHPLQFHPLQHSPPSSEYSPHYSEPLRSNEWGSEEEEDVEALPQMATIWRNSFDDAPPIGEISWFGDPPTRRSQ